MKTKSEIALALVVVWAGWQAQAAAINPAVEYSTASTLFDAQPYTLGYKFSLSTTLTVNALGYWVDGLSNNHQVGLWTSGGSPLASTTVLGTDPVTGHFRYHTISDLTLGPGT